MAPAEAELADGSGTTGLAISQHSEWSAALAAMRPRQWLKNVLVLAAPATAGVLTKPRPALETLVALLVFTAASASVYLVNDTVDAAADRLHPVKRDRPIAAGELRPATALGVAGLLLAAALTAAALVRPQLLAVVIAYAVVSYGYCLGLKRVPVVELGIVASGFVLRASAGGAATHVAISPWFLIVTSAAALFLVAGKRYAELVELGESGADHRVALGLYNATFLLVCRILAACVAVTSYCLWVFERANEVVVGARFHNLVWFEFSIVPVVLGLLTLELAIERGRGGEPEEFALHDRGLQVLGACWIALIALGIYA